MHITHCTGKFEGMMVMPPILPSEESKSIIMALLLQLLDILLLPQPKKLAVHEPSGILEKKNKRIALCIFTRLSADLHINHVAPLIPLNPQPIHLLWKKTAVSPTENSRITEHHS
jgi:hypothetical protein